MAARAVAARRGAASEVAEEEWVIISTPMIAATVVSFVEAATVSSPWRTSLHMGGLVADGTDVADGADVADVTNVADVALLSVADADVAITLEYVEKL